MVGWTCFCGEREPVQAAVRKDVRLLKALPDLRGAELADKWMQTVQAPDTRFNCGSS